MLEQYSNNAKGPAKDDILADFIIEGQFIKSEWIKSEDLYVTPKRVFASISKFMGQTITRLKSEEEKIKE